MPYTERVDLGAAGSIGITIDADGVLVDDVSAAPGWQIVAQHPKAGLLRRGVKPAPSAVVVLTRTGPDGHEERELEVGQLNDGSWELAVRRQGPCPPNGPITTPGGSVTVPSATSSARASSASVVQVAPADGWSVRSREEGPDDIVVVFARDEEEWEVVVLLDDDAPPVADIDHRRQLGHLT